MIVDSNHIAALYANNKIQGSFSAESPKDVKQDGSLSANTQTSDVGPAVFADLSSAALETSRGINAVSQPANQNRMADAEKEINPAMAHQDGKGVPESYRKGQLDLVI